MDVRRRIFPITRSIALGPFASPERLPVLVESGVTHVLNVGEAPGVLTTSDGPFLEIAWRPIMDWQQIPDAIALECVGTLHRMVCESQARVYVHCVAGWNRSPTVVWLYLLACGMTSESARRLICERAWDAIPGHPRLVDAELVERIQELGRRLFVPHPRPEALEPASIPVS